MEAAVIVAVSHAVTRAMNSISTMTIAADAGDEKAVDKMSTAKKRRLLTPFLTVFRKKSTFQRLFKKTVFFCMEYRKITQDMIK